MPTLVAGNPNHAFLVRHYTPRGDPAQMSRPVTEPTGAVTASDHHSLVMPFLTPYNSTGPAQGVDEPHRTMDTRDRYNLIDPAVPIEDCGFRMLEPAEVGRAMAFTDDYKVLGNKRERVRQYGNAVTPPVMSLLMEACIDTFRP